MMFGRSRPAAAVRTNEGLEHVVALDLGQVAQVSGLALLETRDGGETVAVRQLRRYQPGIAYPDVVASVERLLGLEPVALTKDEAGYRRRPTVVVGVTAVGHRVGRFFAGLPADVRYVSISAGDAESIAKGVHKVPKRELVGALQGALQEKRLQVSTKLADAGALLDELQGYTTRVRLGDDGDDWRREGGRLDDLVLALALGYWAIRGSGRAPELDVFVLGAEGD